MSTATHTKRWIHLHHADAPASEVIVTTDDDRCFSLPLEAAIRACGSADKIAQFTPQFNEVMRRLEEWTGSHAGDIQEAYVTLRDAGLLFLVVRRTKAFNEQLEDALTDLDIEIAQDESLPLVKLSVLALPNTGQESIDSFLAPSNLLTYKYA